jgi:hypothetical protein
MTIGIIRRSLKKRRRDPDSKYYGIHAGVPTGARLEIENFMLENLKTSN